MIPPRAGATRHLLHPRTPWLYFHRDHPLAVQLVTLAKRKKEETWYDQADRLQDILVLPEDDDEPDWRDGRNDDSTPIGCCDDL